MLYRTGQRRFPAILGAIALLAGLAAGPPATQASLEDVAMFYDSLAQYGSWVDYENYGPVWYPTRVSPNWRPYLDGRWVPSPEGWAFETSEPWGWATYHYGNWLPTTDYGWVWYPGSTWYPSTAAWRTSDDYVGWAPIPPPSYIPPSPAFYPAGGYYPGIPLMDLITAPFWIFAQAANFLLGFGQPFVPAYSYYNCGCLAPYNYGPVVYGGTFLLTDFYYPGYAPGAYYCFGPPFPYASRISNINIEHFNRYVDTVNFARMRNVLPPESVLHRHAYLRGAIPEAVREGRRFEVHRVSDVARAEHELNRPGVLRPPANVPRLEKTVPRVTAAPGRERTTAGTLRGVKGMGLPRQAQRTETPQMRRQVRVQRQLEQPRRMETRPEFRLPAGKFVPTPSREVRPTPSPAGRPQAAETRPTPRREFQAAPRERFQAAPRREFQAAPSRQFTPRAQYRPALPREFQAVPHPAPRAFSAPTYHPAPVFRQEFRPAPAPRAAPAPRGPAREGGPGRR